MNQPITPRAFGDGQQQEIAGAAGELIRALSQAAPQLGPHFHSGGIIEIKTMSGAHLKLGFEPQRGGLIIPGGIAPRGPISRGGL